MMKFLDRIRHQTTETTRYLGDVRQALLDVRETIDADEVMASVSGSLRAHYEGKLDHDYLGDKHRLEQTMFRHALLHAFLDETDRAGLSSCGFFRALSAVESRGWDVPTMEEAGDFWVSSELARSDSKVVKTVVDHIKKAIQDPSIYASAWLVDFFFPVLVRVV
jgi:hypothetical protein